MLYPILLASAPHNLTAFVVIGVYFCFLIGVGVVFGRLVRNSEDYFKAGGQASWWLVGLSIFMSGISTYTFVGNAAGIFKSGWSPMAIYAANVASSVVCALFMAAWYRQMRVVTVAEAIRVRFGKRSEIVLASLMVLNGLVWTGAVLYGLSVFFTLLLPGVPQTMVILSVGVVVIGYCTIGGNWAVMANDFVQGLILVSVTVLITVLCFQEAGGVAAFFEAIAASSAAEELQFVTPLAEGVDSMESPYGLSWIVVTFVVQFFNMISLFQGIRYFSAKDGMEAVKASWLSAGLMVVGCLVFFVPPIFSRIFMYEEVMAMHADPAKAPEFAFAVVSQKLLPAGAFSLMLVSMLAAAISSLDTGLNRNSGLIVRDLLPAFLRAIRAPQIPQGREVLAGKVATMLMGVMIVGFALFYAQLQGVTLFDLMLSIGNMLMLPQFIPLVLFLFIRNVPGWSALASMFAGFVPSFVDLAFGLGWSYQEKSLAIVSSSTLVFVLSTFFYRFVSNEERQAHADFYATMLRKIDYAAEVGANSDAFQKKQIGVFSIALGCLVLLLLFLDNPLSGRISILVIAAFVLSVGFLMYWLSQRDQKEELVEVNDSTVLEYEREKKEHA
ncbi:hypothetical protein [Pelagicoccus sp. SDUM812005]|uniref:sodium:solute symporter family protein n=1 Tax=Pelagicoccus sp. SDUM812005 TaxID=3041257 RepID=UPI0028101FA7|nr:hypothetical protein [Pelagicoccus sp. SDUM812005]MDQ8180325.1 hypothetical protein [Pelagicoccus sp. SDUM812005]